MVGILPLFCHWFLIWGEYMFVHVSLEILLYKPNFLEEFYSNYVQGTLPNLLIFFQDIQFAPGFHFCELLPILECALAMELSLSHFCSYN